MKRWLPFVACGLLLVGSHPRRAYALRVDLEFDDVNSISSGVMTAELSKGSENDVNSYEWHTVDTTMSAIQLWAREGPGSATTTLGSCPVYLPWGDYTELFFWGVALQGYTRHDHEPVEFSSGVNATWELYWKLLPNVEVMRGEPVAVSFGLPYEVIYPPVLPEECSNASSQITYQVQITIDGNTSGPYELRRPGCSATLQGNWPDPLAITTVNARVGDTIKLSLRVDALAETLDPDTDSTYMGGPLVKAYFWVRALPVPPPCEPPNCPSQVCSTAQWHAIDFPSCERPSTCLVGKLGETIEADSGERMEVWWVNAPFPHYELRYYPPDDQVGFPISEAVFGEGCNYAEYYAPDDNDNGKPDYFCLTEWHCWDFGYDHGTPGFLDHVLERYDVQESTFSATLFIHQYSPGCMAPVGTSGCWCDLKQLKKECLPTFDRILSVTPFLPSMPLGTNIRPSLADLLMVLSLQMSLNPGPTTVMGHLPVRLCDMDWDGDGDPTDFQTASAALGACWQDARYYSLADIDGDGCVRPSDLDSLFRVSLPSSGDGGLINAPALDLLARESHSGQLNGWWNDTHTDGSARDTPSDLMLLSQQWLESVP
jgi:hypothetical protein